MATDCNDTSIPEVDNTSLECCELVSDKCVKLSEAATCLSVGKDQPLSLLIQRLCDWLNNVSFLGLSDTPAEYTGKAGSLLTVNQSEDGLEYTENTLLPFPEFTVSTTPDPTLSVGRMIMVTDEIGGYVPAFSDGTNWRRVTDRNIIS